MASKGGSRSGGVPGAKRPANGHHQQLQPPPTQSGSSAAGSSRRSVSHAAASQSPPGRPPPAAAAAAAAAPRKISGGGNSVASSRRSYVKSYCSWRDESIAGESAISLGSIDENGDSLIPEELIRSIGMDSYTTEEKVLLDSLLQRLLATRRQDERRREKLQRELHRVMAQVSRVQNRGEQPGLLYSLCELCGGRLYLVHRRYVCNRCAYLACQNCVYLVRGAEPQCRLCRLEVLNQAKSGDWFLEVARSRSEDETVFFGPDILYASLCMERQRLVAEEKQRRDQRKAEAEERQRQEQQQLEASQGKKGKKGDHKKDKKAEAALRPPGHPDSAAFGAAARRESGQTLQSNQQHQQQPAVAIKVQSPDHLEGGDIRPEDSVSVVGERGGFDVPDNGAILIEQALRSPSFQQREPSTAPTASQHRASNLLSVDATSRESMTSNVSETEASYGYGLTPSGEVEVNLQYNYKERKFTVNVVQCRNLPHLEGNPPNPYVKTYLLPDKTKRSKRRTQTRRATANPIYSEQLSYDIVKSELETRTLQVSVWHNLTFGSNVFLGEARVPMENYRFDAGSESLELGRRIEVPVPLPTLMYRGDIMLALRYLSGELIKANQLAKDDPMRKDAKAGRLEVWVQNCRNLAGSGSGASPYVKGYLVNPAISSKSRAKDPKTKQKSAIVKGDMNPNFNSILAFESVSLADLKSRSLELTVWDYVKIGKNDFLGGVRLNIGDGHLPCMDARGHEALMWTRMLEKPNAWVEGSLLLRPNMDFQEIQAPSHGQRSESDETA